MKDADYTDPFKEFKDVEPRQEKIGNVTYHYNITQGSDEWLKARLGILTASEMKLILTPATLKVAKNGEVRAHLYELLAQRVTQFVEPRYVSDDMLRGHEDEILARQIYSENIAPVHEVGFITNDKWGFTLGYSPDGLVGDDGLIECKSRRQKFQVQTIIENLGEGTIPKDFALQCQSGLMISERKWLDFISYSGGMPYCKIRVHSVPEVQTAIEEAATAFEENIREQLEAYRANLEASPHAYATERRDYEEDIIL